LPLVRHARQRSDQENRKAEAADHG
jgi:hypothetical protein